MRLGTNCVQPVLWRNRKTNVLSHVTQAFTFFLHHATSSNFTPVIQLSSLSCNQQWFYKTDIYSAVINRSDYRDRCKPCFQYHWQHCHSWLPLIYWIQANINTFLPTDHWPVHIRVNAFMVVLSPCFYLFSHVPQTQLPSPYHSRKLFTQFFAQWQNQQLYFQCSSCD